MTDESTPKPKNKGSAGRGGKIGNKGGSGRPSNALRIRLDAIAKKFVESGDSLDVAGNPEHPRWLGLGQFATEMTLGKAQQEVKADTTLTVRIVNE